MKTGISRITTGSVHGYKMFVFRGKMKKSDSFNPILSLKTLLISKLKPVSRNKHEAENGSNKFKPFPAARQQRPHIRFYISKKSQRKLIL